MERVGGDASFLEKLVLMSEKSKTGDVTTNETSAVDNRALIIPTTTTTMAATTDSDGVEKVGCNDNDVTPPPSTNCPPPSSLNFAATLAGAGHRGVEGQQRQSLPQRKQPP